MINELITTIQARLLSDTTLCGATPVNATSPYPGLVKGGVYDRKIRREGFGNTPRAYDTDLHVRPCIIIMDMAESILPQIGGILGGTSHIIRVTCLAPAHGAGKSVLSQISDRAINVILLNSPDTSDSTEPYIPIIQGKRMFPYLSGSLPRKDSEEYPQVIEETFMIEYRFIRRHPQI